MGWIIYNSLGEPLVTQEQHDHTSADASGPLTNDEHDGYSEYDEIAAPGAPAASKARLYTKDLSALSAMFYVDEADNEFWLADSIFRNLPIGNLSSWATAVTGSSAATRNVNRFDLSPNGGTAHIYLNENAYGPTRGSGTDTLNWDRVVLWKLRFTLFTAAAGGSNNILLGHAIGDAPDTLTDKGIGISISNAAFRGFVHDGIGTTLTGTLVTLTVNQVYDVLIISRGDGTVEWFIDGASVGTSAGGPVGNSTAAHTIMSFQGFKATGASNRLMIHQISLADLG
ncbi:hypothetical protein LCGC14_1658790 [marine sediment metagenome]|uniref:Uncharacterized protein n=1 Tax=marine sediment metagenome TaxID=412755 RepID=A0A0F9KAL7_9ZZZZ